MYVTVKLQNACFVYKLSWNRNLIELKLLMLSCVNMSLTVGTAVITIFFLSLPRILTITRLKQPVSLWYTRITLQLFCGHTMWYL